MSYQFLRYSFFEPSKNADRAYEIEMRDNGGGQWVVNYAYGRSGTNLAQRNKYIGSLSGATAAFDELKRERNKKRYVLEFDTSVPAATPRILPKGQAAPVVAVPAAPVAPAASAPASSPPADQVPQPPVAPPGHLADKLRSACVTNGTRHAPILF